MNATAFAQLMAAYNTWMNEKLYRLCSKIPDADRKKDLGAFFGSIHNTLDHIVWADEALLIRLRDEDRAIERYQPPRISDFDELWKARQVFDDEISSWAEGVSDAIVDQPYEFKSKIYNKTRNIRRYVLAVHLFNHQTHHRGQVTALLSQLGHDFGVTDLPWIPGIDIA